VPGVAGEGEVTGQDQVHTHKYDAALSLLNMEGTRLFSTFSAFLVAEALIAGFLLNVLATDQHAWYAIAGAVFGLLIVLVWVAAFFRHTKSYNWRMALTRKAEPAGWGLVSGDARLFAKNKTVWIGGDDFKQRWLARLSTKATVGALIAFFAAGFVAIGVEGGLRLSNSQASHAEVQTCTAVQDYRDDLRVTSGSTLQSDLRRAGRAANRSTNRTLAAQVSHARVALSTAITKESNGNFHNVDGRRVDARVAKVARTCSRAGTSLR
jgi:hypothetical protein